MDQKWQSRLSQARGVGDGQCWVCTPVEVQVGQEHQQPLQNMVGWLWAQMGSHWEDLFVGWRYSTSTSGGGSGGDAMIEEGGEENKWLRGHAAWAGCSVGWCQ